MQKIIKLIVITITTLLITIILLEMLLQVAFLSLPQAITQRMPQYPERYGIQFNTQHGAREYPANEHVNLEVNQYTGDLYQISCLSPNNAQSIDPYIVNYQRNENGFRTPDLEMDTANIVILGDSFTAAESIIKPYWEHIDDSLVVLGLPGSGTLEQSILLETFGLPYNPSIVVLAYFAGNDLNDNETFNDLQEQNLTFADKTHQGRTPLDYLVTFHLALFVRDALTATTQADCHYPLYAETTPPTLLAFYDAMVSLFTMDREAMINSDAYKITASRILDIARLAKSNGAELILAYIPQKAEVYWNLLDETSKDQIINNLPIQNELGSNLISTDFDSHLDIQSNLLRELADESDFHFLDFTPFLTESAVNGQSPYFFADTHWNQLGHDIAGKALSDYISQFTLDKNDDS